MLLSRVLDEALGDALHHLLPVQYHGGPCTQQSSTCQSVDILIKPLPPQTSLITSLTVTSQYTIKSNKVTKEYLISYTLSISEMFLNIKINDTAIEHNQWLLQDEETVVYFTRRGLDVLLTFYYSFVLQLHLLVTIMLLKVLISIYLFSGLFSIMSL